MERWWVARRDCGSGGFSYHIHTHTHARQSIMYSVSKRERELDKKSLIASPTTTSRQHHALYRKEDLFSRVFFYTIKKRRLHAASKYSHDHNNQNPISRPPNSTWNNNIANRHSHPKWESCMKTIIENPVSSSIVQRVSECQTLFFSLWGHPSSLLA